MRRKKSMDRKRKSTEDHETSSCDIFKTDTCYPTLTSVLSKADDGIACYNLNKLREELENLLLSLRKKYNKLLTNQSSSELPSSVKDKNEKESDIADPKISGFEYKTPQRNKTSSENAQRPTFSVRAKCKMQFSKSQDTLIKSEFNLKSDVPKQQKNDTSNRFWSFVDVYCADVTMDDIKMLEKWIESHDLDSEYQDIPFLGSHYSSKWTENDILEEIREVNGQVRPGQLLAIMGASGAGKTTLLNVLTRRNLRRLIVEGDVLVNGENVGSAMTRISAYVQQDDLFIGTLTVKEHLVFQALLRMDRHLSFEERMIRVDEVLVEMGLSKCCNTMIGQPGTIKGISGGEMKRQAFAAEVLTNPSLMFCDEPTSGLDSFMSQSIVTVLKDISAGGRTIVCTIHQPSSEVYELFDNLLLMAEGRVAYMGAASKALGFFERAGLQCPVNYNPADFFIHNLAIVPGKEAECKAKVMNVCEQFSRESRQLERTTSISPSITNEQFNSDNSRYKASWCTQFRVILKRSWISLAREPMFTKVRILQSLFISILLGLIYLNQNYDDKGVMNINGALFIIVTNITFTNVFSVVNAFCLEMPIFLREHWNGMYRTDVYFLSKTLAELPILVIVTVIFTTILYWMVGLNSDYRAFLICLGITAIIANTAASFGYMVSCLASSLNVALGISTPLLMPLLLFGGFYLNASVPVYFIWVKYISWFYYGNEALVINQWKNVQNITCTSASCGNVTTSGKDVLDTLSFDENNFIIDLVLITVLLIAYRILAFLALLLKSSRKT